MEQFGNTLGVPFVCPLGNKHPGHGFCSYTGKYRCNLFHGYGEFQCIQGPYYKGDWFKGLKHGKGEQYFMREGELGDTARQCIGGVGSMYRMKLFKGDYDENIRHGQGILTYTNSDTLEGKFIKGQPHGMMLYTFASTGKLRLALYVRGDRKEWIDQKLKEMKKDQQKKTKKSVLSSMSQDTMSLRTKSTDSTMNRSVVSPSSKVSEKSKSTQVGKSKKTVTKT